MCLIFISLSSHLTLLFVYCNHTLIMQSYFQITPCEVFRVQCAERVILKSHIWLAQEFH